MYNIIIIFIACILLFLFMNGRKIVEGAKNKGKSGSSKAAARKSGSAAKKSSSAAKKSSSGLNAAETIANIKEQVYKILPSLLSSAINPINEDIKSTQSTIKNEIKNIEKSRNDFDKKSANSNTLLDEKIKESIQKITDTQNTLLSNLSQQYNMYKTGLSSQVSDATKSIKDMNANISDASNKASVARDESKEFSDLSQRIYDNVFGASTARVVQQDNRKLKSEAFTPMNTIDTNLFDLEKQLVDAINNFNTIYYNYIRCSSGGSTDCGNKKTESDVAKAAETVGLKITDLQNAYNRSPKNSETDFKNNHQEILNKAKSIDELRRSLDSKMNAILKNKIEPNELTREYDSTVYTGIMWSVLATSVIFYVFTEM